MITLITGQPGAGKTLLCVAEFLRKAVAEGRKVYVEGVPGLTVEHEPAPPLAEWTKWIDEPSRQSGRKLVFTFDEGALVVVDEAQDLFRPRAAGSKVPDAVAAFETHRHQGLDFVLMTQGVGLIDPNIRKLVGRHIHVRDLGVLGRRRYEWPECGNVEQFRTAPIQGRYRVAREAFPLYKSASLHVKPKRGVPKGLAVVALALPLLVGMTAWVYSSVKGKTEAAPVSVSASHSGGAVAAGVGTVAAAEDKSGAMLVEFEPRVRGRPETAPAFDELRKAKQMPVVVGCIAVESRCKCFTQQGTDAQLTAGECRAWLARPPFNPYQDAEVRAVPVPQSAARGRAPEGGDSGRLSGAVEG